MRQQNFIPDRRHHNTEHDRQMQIGVGDAREPTAFFGMSDLLRARLDVLSALLRHAGLQRQRMQHAAHLALQRLIDNLVLLNARLAAK